MCATLPLGCGATTSLVLDDKKHFSIPQAIKRLTAKCLKFISLFIKLHIDNIGNAIFSTEFQDIHVMIFMGFGFLATFLVRYGFSGSGFNMLLAAMAIQWAVLMNGFLLPQRHHRREIHISMKRYSYITGLSRCFLTKAAHNV